MAAVSVITGALRHGGVRGRVLLTGDADDTLEVLRAQALPVFSLLDDRTLRDPLQTCAAARRAPRVYRCVMSLLLMPTLKVNFLLPPQKYSSCFLRSIANLNIFGRWRNACK